MPAAPALPGGPRPVAKLAWRGEGRGGRARRQASRWSGKTKLPTTTGYREVRGPIDRRSDLEWVVSVPTVARVPSCT
eukprot:4793210-Pyramimonas_sp.AAC.1